MKNKTQKILASDLAKIYPNVCETWQKEIAKYLVKFVDEKYIIVEEELILKAYKQADNSQKSLLEKYFEIEYANKLFKFNTYSKVCEGLGEEELTEKLFSFLPKERRKKALAQAKVAQLEKFFNGKWIADWKNQNQYKYYPYFTLNASGGLLFCSSHCHASYFYAEAGFYKDQETSDFVGKTFIDIYEDLK